MKSLDDNCPVEHRQFGPTRKCPWCDEMRCPRNMPDHITLRHWDEGEAARSFQGLGSDLLDRDGPTPLSTDDQKPSV